jgi:ABC-type nitrate/sulfonate/bicarbonate transport system ATPase subunit
MPVLVAHDVGEAVFLSDRVYVLCPRPALRGRELRIELPRPRTRTLLDDPLFLGYRRELFGALGL